jgi:hypothetical protein
MKTGQIARYKNRTDRELATSYGGLIDKGDGASHPPGKPEERECPS